MKTITSTLQFSKEYPAAYAALPEPYREDDCLKYLISGGGDILAQPQQEQERILGFWTVIFINDKWYDYITGHPIS